MTVCKEVTIFSYLKNIFNIFSTSVYLSWVSFNVAPVLRDVEVTILLAEVLSLAPQIATKS